MTKKEFLKQLRRGLSGLSKEDREEKLAFYSEMIDDRMEEGLTEEEAVAEMDCVEDIAARFAPSENKPCWGLGVILLLILGSPVWLSLLIAAFSVVLSLYVSLWAVIIALWAVEFSLWGCTLGALASGVVFFLTGQPVTAVAMLGAALVCAGVSVFLFYGCMAAAKGMVHLTKWVFTLTRRKNNA